MNEMQIYPIGTLGQKWGDQERKAWLNVQKVQRLYSEHVSAKIEALEDRFDIDQYGVLAHSPGRYPLVVVKTRRWDIGRPNILITGGVHGYETSGVQGAIRFLETRAGEFSAAFNIVVAPCVSPWGYETINRWNPNAIDPNRSFHAASPSEEASALMRYLNTQDIEFTAHFDLHETTDSDNNEFRPALAARDATEHENWHIPDGFYLVGDTQRPVPEFQQAIVKSVEKVTHIAPPDSNGKIIGEKLEQWGVINYAAGPLGLCMGVTDAKFVTTTEVYPDSPQVNDENCINAQVAAVTGGLDYLKNIDFERGR